MSNGVKTGGYSLRQSLEMRGITTEVEMKKHLRLAASLLKAGVIANASDYFPLHRALKPLVK